MSKMSGKPPIGYFEYTVPPLEGLWWFEDQQELDFSMKDRFCWTSMIRQPEFVTEEVFNWAIEEVKRKKPELDVSKAYFKSFSEGVCVQMMHVGPYDNEPETIAQLERFIVDNHYKNAISRKLADGTIRNHHEIYLSDPRRAKPENLKTVIRIPIENKE
ncbi:GyrI-like domain-containing protein [Bacillus massilioanorexius]|uniref:GyrI-like domain-containing protein n=1 Tax=Bacillus TaxID=1386 RepID=UPI001FE91DDC